MKFTQNRLWPIVFGSMYLISSRSNFGQIYSYTFSRIGSGSVSGTAFTNSRFTIELFGENKNIANSPYPAVGQNLQGTSTRIHVNGIADAVFIVITSVFIDRVGLNVGFSNILVLHDPSFVFLTLGAPFDPVTVATPHPFELGFFHDVPTTLGGLTIGAAHDITFSSAAVDPSPILSAELNSDGHLVIKLTATVSGDYAIQSKAKVDSSAWLDEGVLSPVISSAFWTNSLPTGQAAYYRAFRL